MDISTLCTVVAALRVVPDRSQFFQYDSVCLSCGQQGNSSEWRVKRNTSLNSNQDCSRSREGSNDSHCIIDDLYPFDSGVYWCESAAGECSDAVSIYVTAGSVILESPVLPVVEGEPVTLRCRNNNSSSSSSSSSSSLTADFYKDGLLLRSSPTGEMTIHGVSKSDEGLYKCDVLDGGESPVSRLDVRGRPEPAESTLALPVVAACLLLVSAVLLCLWWSDKGKIDPSLVLYNDVTSTRRCKQKGRSQNRHPFLQFSVAVYRPNPVRSRYTPDTVMIYRA